MTNFYPRAGVVPRDLVPTGHRFYLDYQPIEDYGLYVHKDGLTVKAASLDTAYRSIPGRYGTYDVSLTDLRGNAFTGRREVTFKVGSVGLEDDFIRTQAKLGALNGHLTTIRDMRYPGYWSGRLQVGDWTITRNTEGVFVDATCELTMDADPYMYGDAEAVQLAKGDTEFSVDGNRPVWPVIDLTVDGTPSALTLTVTRKSDSWTKTLRIVAGGVNGVFADGSHLIVDMGEGIVGLNGSPLYNIDVTSDFWPMPEGPVKVSVNDAAGVLHYTPEWSI